MPGVTGAGALQIALKQGGLVPQGPLVLAGQGPLLLLVARQLRKAGAGGEVWKRDLVIKKKKNQN